MPKFTLKTLLLLFALACALVAASVWGLDHYRQYRFRNAIAPAWEEAPVVSTLVTIVDTNDIILIIDGGGLRLSNTSGASLEKCEVGGDHRYDLNCSSGKFRVTYYGDIYTDLTAAISPGDRPFDVLLDSFLLDDKSSYTTAPLWLLRTQSIPIGCNVRLQHYQTPTKMGIISGTLETRPNTILHVFDSTGEFSIGILPIDPSIATWDELANRVALIKSSGSGGYVTCRATLMAFEKDYPWFDDSSFGHDDGVAPLASLVLVEPAMYADRAIEILFKYSGDAVKTSPPDEADIGQQFTVRLPEDFLKGKSKIIDNRSVKHFRKIEP